MLCWDFNSFVIVLPSELRIRTTVCETKEHKISDRYQTSAEREVSFSAKNRFGYSKFASLQYLKNNVAMKIERKTLRDTTV